VTEGWRKLHNKELNCMCASQNVIRAINQNFLFIFCQIPKDHTIVMEEA
jgi:hypothetical protein